MEEGAESENIRREKVVMGSLRSNMLPELRTYLDHTKPANCPEFVAQVEEWVRSQPYRKSIYTYRSSGGYKYNTQSSVNSISYGSGQ